jgi:NTE family protein
MQARASSIFDGLLVEQLSQIKSNLPRRRFASGSTVVAEGDSLRELYVVESGAADVFISDRLGEHRINRVGAGTTLGDMSLFTGQAASATVRAATDLDVLVLSDTEFRRTATAFPIIYHNLGAILSERLARSSRRSVREQLGRTTVLLDRGAPPLLGYALACSVAWHARASTLLLFIEDGEPPTEVAALAVPPSTVSLPHQLSQTGDRHASNHARAQVMVTTPTGAFAPEVLGQTVEDLCSSYEYVLVQVRTAAPPGLAARSIVLNGLRDGSPSSSDARGYAIHAWLPNRRPRPDREGILSVPELTAVDESALRRGVLPATTAAGGAIGWAARDLTGQKVGVALGGGASKGYAHFGVMDVLCRAGLTVDYLAGTSIGAVVASLWAGGRGAQESARLLDTVGNSSFRLALPFASLLSSTALSAKVMQIAGALQIEHTPTPLAIVAADILTGQEVVFRHGPIGPALMASMAIPGIYPPQRLGRHLLVDGGVLNPVPSNVVAAMGADIVIAVRLGSTPTNTAGARVVGGGATRRLSIFQTLTRSLELMQSKMATDTASTATIVIEPDLGDIAGVSLRRFAEGRRYIAGGQAAARAALPRIAAALPWLQDS